MLNLKTSYDYICAIEELLDEACNKLSPEAFDKVKDSIDMILSDFE